MRKLLGVGGMMLGGVGVLLCACGHCGELVDYDRGHRGAESRG